ncbi:MAG: 5-formyltetrahydrofolate cyclo-ligase [Clostridia bacterium]|nr:5-formyltetrahydrofolate cyclo-ligase [Clostridia bacterium]
MPIEDIRALKTRLREEYRAKRTSLAPQEKEQRDRCIADTVRSLWQYRDNKLLLIYVSTPIEVDTRTIITQALEDGKTVAVPRCIPQTRDMEFYRIRSLEELEKGTFGVLEPQPNPENRIDDLSQGLCVIPAFCYDFAGYRLGYGKGYYDRFLARFGGNMIGICYSDCIRHRLPHGRFDRAVELIVTEKYIRRTTRLGSITHHRGGMTHGRR